MDDSNKYLIHATITADGVVERSDVVGAIFGQTEGLLGEELDLRNLQRASKVGRIDVEIESRGGQSTGEVTIATSLDRIETATLAAALETISRVGPCRATVEVTDLEDVRAAKRRQVVERAQELVLSSFDDAMTSEELVEEVRRRIRVEDITRYEGLPAGPRVADSDAIIVVEGRADVQSLLKAGIKNAIAVEGTDVPEAVAELSQERTVTAFLDGDRGGELILRELAQVGDVDYVTFAPPDRSVEDLSRGEVLAALREKVPYDSIADTQSPVQALADQSERARTAGGTVVADVEADAGEATAANAAFEELTVDGEANADATSNTEAAAESSAGDDSMGAEAGANDAPTAGNESPPETLPEHVNDVIGAETRRARLLDGDLEVLDDISAGTILDTIETADPVPEIVLLDGPVTQQLLDVAASRGVRQVIGTEYGDFTKRPTDVRLRTAEDVLGTA